MTLKYKDEDGDLITLFDSADLAVAISYSRVLKLTLFVNGEISVGGKPANIIANAHLIKELRGIRNRITEILDTLCDETNINGGNVPIGKHVEAIDEVEVLGANQLSGMKLESKEFDPLQKPIVNDDQLSVSSQSSSKLESVPPRSPVMTSQQAPPVAPIPSTTAAPPVMNNQPRYPPNPPYGAQVYPGYEIQRTMTSEVSTKPVNGPPQPGQHPPTTVVQSPFPMHQQIPGSIPQTGYQPEQQQQHQMQPAPQATSGPAVVSAAGHPQMSAFMGYPQQAPHPQAPAASVGNSGPVQASPFAPPRLPGGAIQNHNNPYAAIGAGQRGPTPNFGRYPQAPQYQ